MDALNGRALVQLHLAFFFILLPACILSDDISTTPPPPTSIVIDARQDAEWPTHCAPDQIAVLVDAFARAFSAGDVDALKVLLPDGDELVARENLFGTAAADPDVAARAAVAFQWFSMPAGAGEPEVMETVEETLAFVSNRYAAGDRLTIQSIQPLPDTYGLGLIDFGVMATLHTADGQANPLEGKAGIDCSHQRLYVWSIAAT